MGSRKATGPPYSKRHLRRLKAGREELLFRKVRNRLMQNISACSSSSSSDAEEHDSSPISRRKSDLIRKPTRVRNKMKKYLSKFPNNEKSDSSMKFKNSIGTLENHNCTDRIEVHFEKIESNINHIESHEKSNENYGIDDYLKYLVDDTSKVNADDSDTDSEYEFDAEDLELKKSEKDKKFINEIRQWSVDNIHAIPHTALNGLLHILINNTNTSFPKDARTLLKTARSTRVVEMDGGHYWHYGLQSALISFISMIVQKNISIDNIELLVNIDGAPLAKSSEKGLWIISCSESVLKEVELIGLYYGEDKPSDPNELINAFFIELNELIRGGIEYSGKKYGVKLLCLVCDAPAKAYILCVKYHTGYFSCTKCNKRGQWEGKVCFPGEIGVLRTDQDFKDYLYVDDGLNDGYQQNKTILCDVPGFGLVTNVVLDYMHLICLGVMLKLIELWIGGPPNVKLSDQQRKIISEKLVDLKNYMPSDFSRKPRQFKNVRRLWKAHELRQFLLYSGPVVLFGVLRDQLYQNFLYLHISSNILVNPLLCKYAEYLNLADELLKCFVKDFEMIYGCKNVTFNIHNLLHVVSDVKNFGCMDNYSAFRFENHIRKIKRLVRKGDKPLQQIARRLSEINFSKNCAIDSQANDLVVQKNHCDGPVLSNLSDISQFKILRKKNLYLNCTDRKNNCVLLKDGTYIECKNFITKSDNTIYIIGKPFQVVQSFYSEPIDSQKVSVQIVDESSENFRMYSNKLILAKVCKIPFNKYFVVFPMMHTYSDDMS